MQAYFTFPCSYLTQFIFSYFLLVVSIIFQSSIPSSNFSIGFLPVSILKQTAHASLNLPCLDFRFEFFCWFHSFLTIGFSRILILFPFNRCLMQLPLIETICLIFLLPVYFLTFIRFTKVGWSFQSIPCFPRLNCLHRTDCLSPFLSLGISVFHSMK